MSGSGASVTMSKQYCRGKSSLHYFLFTNLHDSLKRYEAHSS